MRTPLLKKLLVRVQATLTAAAFAEESDVKTARQIVVDAETHATDRGPTR